MGTERSLSSTSAPPLSKVCVNDHNITIIIIYRGTEILMTSELHYKHYGL